MYSTRPLQVLLFSDHISLNGPSRIRRLCICLYIYRKQVRHYTRMLAELIGDICKIVHCSLVQFCEVGSIHVYSF